jgi:hypothetical protein
LSFKPWPPDSLLELSVDELVVVSAGAAGIAISTAAGVTGSGCGAGAAGGVFNGLIGETGLVGFVGFVSDLTQLLLVAIQSPQTGSP